MCDHVSQVYNKNKSEFLQCYSMLVFPKLKTAKAIRANLVCYDCGGSNYTLHACVLCVHVACQRCFRKHAMQERHIIGAHMNSGSTRCYECNDVVYHPPIEEYIIQMKADFVGHRRLHPVECLSGRNPSCLRTLEPMIIDAKSGYRGIVNLGNSCYMNVIIQAIAHTPLLSRFLMAGEHACVSPEASLECLTCELSRICQEMYSDNKDPIAPTRFLMLVWKRLGFAVPNSTQDCHELFISLVERMHNDLTKSNNPRETRDCSCIVDRVFSSEWHSTISCPRCPHKSITTDFNRDLAINLPGHQGSSSRNHLLSADELAALSIDDSAPGLDFPMGAAGESENLTLSDCLNTHMRPELITWDCVLCHSKHGLKKYSPWRPPLVWVVQLKKFANTGDKNTRMKNLINKFVSFPVEMNLTPDARYSLYCVVVFVGGKHGTQDGHFYCYLKNPDSWVIMNDGELRVVSEETVLTSNAYLLFYSLLPNE